MHVAHFVHRYPPALGDSEAYFARLGAYLAGRGDTVSVWTTTAVELAEMWRANPERERRGDGRSPASARDWRTRSASDGVGEDNPVARAPGSPTIRRYSPLHFPARRYILKALSLLPVRPWQCLTVPCNPVCPGMWRDAGRYAGPLDAVHAAAFPYPWPILCGLRLARRRGVPLLLTPFLHLGDPADPRARTRRRYTAPHLRWLLRQADRVFVQTRLEADAVVRLGVREERVVLQGLGVEPAECTGGNREAARASWGGAPDEVVVGHLANASAEKGTVDLLRAAERAWANGVRFRVVLAGPEMPNFRAFWGGFARKDLVTRLGVLSDPARRDFFAGIDVFALPSRSDSFGLVLLEAWANGKPNVVYRAGGPAELVRDGTDGLQAACGDVGELSAGLAALADDGRLRRALGDSGLSRVRREFRWDDKLELVREHMALASGGRQPPECDHTPPSATTRPRPVRASSGG